MGTLIVILFIGIGATAIMDLWSLLRQQLFGVPAPDYALVGRWIIYMKDGIFHHRSITQSIAMRGEKVIGWVVHYLTGIAYAALLTLAWGEKWISHPSIEPALIIGIITVTAPFFIMQPGMGAGIAGARTPKPNTTRFHSIVNHTVFGSGLYY